MDNTNSGSCIEETTCTGSPLPLLRVGSGDSSAILDPDAAAAGGVAEAESRKLPSSQYKGVVPQPNGRWGAQIYEKHQRVWLGTFNDEPDAARVYDVAAQRFRGRDAVTNFKPLSESNDSDSAELDFLARHSKSEIVDMLRKHTYADELQQSKRAFGAGAARTSTTCYSGNLVVRGNQAGCAREHLFDKTVTPSDVGKLNRLVIPKQHAQKHFPLKMDASSSSGCKGILLNFEDSFGKVWRFRYSYWNSSQSYVLTKGWSRFVKEKSLQAGDVVSFRRTKADGGENQLYIECKPRARPVEVVRLFGVDIFKVPATVEIEQIHVGIKRRRDLGLDQLMKSNSSKFLVKKQCVLGAF